MPINHQFNCAISDDPIAAAAGEVLPSHWGQNHTIGDLLTNANASTMPAGSPVYISAAGSMDLAKADNATTAECIGLVPVAVAHAAQGLVQEVDSITLTTGQWDAITGQTGGLTPSARYYLSAATAGKLTTTAPSTVGASFDVSIGRAINATTMRLRVESPMGV